MSNSTPLKYERVADQARIAAEAKIANLERSRHRPNENSFGAREREYEKVEVAFHSNVDCWGWAELAFRAEKG